MQITIYTIGFTGKSAEEFFALLQNAGVRALVDVRENRVGQLSGFSKYPDIEFFLKTIAGVSYRHAPELAPSREIRQAYQRTKKWEEYEPRFLALMRERRAIARVEPFKEKTALLCSEPGPEKCHRRLVADLLAEKWRGEGHRVDVQHLVTTKGKPAKKRASKVK